MDKWKVYIIFDDNKTIQYNTCLENVLLFLKLSQYIIYILPIYGIVVFVNLKKIYQHVLTHFAIMDGTSL